MSEERDGWTSVRIDPKDVEVARKRWRQTGERPLVRSWRLSTQRFLQMLRDQCEGKK